MDTLSWARRMDNLPRSTHFPKQEQHLHNIDSLHIHKVTGADKVAIGNDQKTF